MMDDRDLLLIARITVRSSSRRLTESSLRWAKRAQSEVITPTSVMADAISSALYCAAESVAATRRGDPTTAYDRACEAADELSIGRAAAKSLRTKHAPQRTTP